MSLQTAQREIFNATVQPAIFHTHSQQFDHGDITQLFLDLDDPSTTSDMVDIIQTHFTATPGLENLSVYNLHEELESSGLFDVSFFIQLAPDANPEEVISQLKALYYTQGLLLTDGEIYTVEEYMQTGFVLVKLIFSFMTFLLGFSFLVSIFGQITSIQISIRHRSKEFGTIRALGTSKSQLKREITAESVILGLIGLVVGLGSGLCATFALLYNIPFNPTIGFVFILPVEFIAGTAALLFAIIWLSALIPLRRIMQINIADAIRKRD